MLEGSPTDEEKVKLMTVPTGAAAVWTKVMLYCAVAFAVVGLGVTTPVVMADAGAATTAHTLTTSTSAVAKLRSLRIFPFIMYSFSFLYLGSRLADSRSGVAFFIFLTRAALR
jgi:hypothetical protein